MAIKKQYNFNYKGMKVTTPAGKSLFMCLRDVNEYTQKFGGSIIYTPEELETLVPVFNDGVKTSLPFKEAIDLALDTAYEEYLATGKKATRVDYFKEDTDKDGNPTGNLKINIKAFERPSVVDASRVAIPEAQLPLVGNGSTIKAQINVVPYVMNGNVGLTAYINAVQLIDLVEFGEVSDFDIEEGYTVGATGTDGIPF